MTGRQIGRVNQQSKGETPLVSGLLQRAAIRSVADQEVEAETSRESRFVHDFSQVPIRGGLPIQAKLTIGAVGDKYEQEADRVAQEVVSRINGPASTQSNQGQSLQRQEEPDEELQAKPNISELQRSPLSPEVQREAMPEEEEELQAKSTLQRQEAMAAPKPLANAGGETSTDLESAIHSARGSGQPLEASLQRSMGQAMGADFSGVKVYTNAQSDHLNRLIQAKAFTTGQDVFFRQGAYDPASRGGQELIAHELTHVVQQNGGEVRRSPLPQQQLSQHPATETPSASVSDQPIQGKGEMTGNSQVLSEVPRPNKTGLPDNLKTGIENLSGYSLNDVNVHYNSSKPAEYDAHAYTQGTEIHVGSGKEEYVPHEAWHVVQQKQGRVRANMQMKGASISEDPALEQEANEMGQKALKSGEIIQAKRDAIIAAPTHSPIIQRVRDSYEQDDSDHGPEDFNLDSGTSYIDWSELTSQALSRRSDNTLKAVFYNLVMYHYAKVGKNSQLPALNDSGVEEVYQTWKKGGVYTRARFKKLIGIMTSSDDETFNIIQRARTGNSYSVNGGYQGYSNNFDYDNVIYYRDSQGNIDFGANPTTIVSNYNSSETPNIDAKDIKWSDPMESSSTVQLANDLTDTNAGLMPSGKKVTLKTATRSQHFAIADDIYPNSRKSTWTWHHLTPKYYMILVDQRVHAKHGHNGGVYLW